jgi:hypothetical protein
MVNEPPIAHRIACAIRVLSAVDLYHQPLLSTDKIDDIRAD